jgi:HK97 family phage portal protein
MGKITDALEKRYSLADLDRDMDTMGWGTTTSTGIKVSEITALNCTAYLAAIRLISETTGQVPVPYYKRVKRAGGTRAGKEKAVEENNYWLLHEEPNKEMDAVAFKSALTGQAIPWGTAYAEIEWDMEAGVIRALWPLIASRVEAMRDPKTSELVYGINTPDGITHILPAYRILNIPGFGFNGITGFNGIEKSRESIGLTMALEKNGATFFGNGSRPGVVLKHKLHMDREAKKANIRHWQEDFGGLSNVNRVAFLDEGVELQEVGVPPETAQLLQTRTFQIQEISRITNVSPDMLMELSHATYSNIEYQDLKFLKYTMGIWFRRWESALNRKTILPADRRFFFYEFLEEALLRADTTARANFYRELFYLGALSPNDIREKENQNPIDDPNGDEHFVQRNMIPLSMADDPAVISGGRNTERQPAGSGSRDGLGEAVKRIADREKTRLIRAAGEYDAKQFKTWKEDFYRDFPDFIKREARRWIGDEAGAVDEFTQKYVKSSRMMLGETEPEKLADVLLNWEEKKIQEH